MSNNGTPSDGRKSFNFRIFSAVAHGYPQIGTLTLASPFVFCSCVVGIGMIAMGAILTTFFRSGVSNMADPLLRNLEITGILFLAIGSLFLISGTGLFFGLCHSYRKAPKPLSPTVQEMLPTFSVDPLSLTPKYPPMFITPQNHFFDQLMITSLGQDDSTVLPGSVMGDENNASSPNTNDKESTNQQSQTV